MRATCRLVDIYDVTNAAHTTITLIYKNTQAMLLYIEVMQVY